VAEHDATRLAARPGRVEDDGQRLGVPRSCRVDAGRVGEEGRERRLALLRFGALDHDRAVGPVAVGECLADLSGAGLVAQHHLDLGVLEHAADLAGRGAGVHRDGHHAAAQDAEIGDRQVDPVGHDDGHPLPGHQPAPGQSAGDRVGR
jgi:hypothetical protein